MNLEEIIRELLDYDPWTGELTWRSRRRDWFDTEKDFKIWNIKHAGKPAGSIGQGYRKVSIFHKRYQAHRLIWLWMTGEWPGQHMDHINHDRSDNRWKNLREATQGQNTRNMSPSLANTSGVTGVHWDKNSHQWVARIMVNGKLFWIGRFGTKDEAQAARLEAETIYGFHPNHGKSITADFV